MKKNSLHSDALELLDGINKVIEDKDRLDTLNILMAGVVKELTADIIDSIVPKQKEQ